MKIQNCIKKLIIVLLIISFTLGVFAGCGKVQETYYSSTTELADKRISTWMGFTFSDYLQSVYPDAEYSYLDTNLLVDALKSNKIDAFAYELCFQNIADNQDLHIHYLPDLQYDTEYAFAFSNNEKGNKLLNEFNSFVSECLNNGSLYTLQNEWMNSGLLKPTEELNTWDTSNGTVEFSTTGASAPFIYICENKVSGYEAALLIEFCKEYHYALNITIASWDGMIASVNAGKSDVCAQSIEASDEHKKSMNLSVNTYEGKFALFVKSDPSKDPKYKSLEELHGLKAASVLGTIDEPVTRENYPENEVITFQAINDCVTAVVNGKADFTYSDEMYVKRIINEDKGVSYIKEPIFVQEFGAIFAKDNKKSQQLKNEFNEFLKAYKESGELNNLVNKWEIVLTDGDKPLREFSGEKISIAINTTTIPYEFIKNDKPNGLEIELIEAFCEKYGYTPEYMDMPFSGMLPAVTSGKANIGISAICKTPERAESVDFSDTYLTDDLLVIVPTAGAVKTSGWDSIKRSFERTFIEENRWKMFADGIFTTIEITLLSAIFGTVLGFIFYVLCRRGNQFINKMFDVLARIFSGLPIVVILMILFYIVFKSANISGTFISIIGFGICTALNVYGSLKTAVKSIDLGQTEGAYALGFTDLQTFYKIILPQALQQFIPNYKNTLINLINGTAVVGFIAVQDLTRTSDLIRAVTYEAFFPLIATAIIYFVLGVVLTYLVKLIQFNYEPERRTKEQIIKKYIND